MRITLSLIATGVSSPVPTVTIPSQGSSRCISLVNPGYKQNDSTPLAIRFMKKIKGKFDQMRCRLAPGSHWSVIPLENVLELLFGTFHRRPSPNISRSISTFGAHSLQVKCNSWMILDPYKKRRIFAHGGSISGFSANIVRFLELCYVS